MKAIQFDRFGGPEVLHLTEVPDPVAGPGEVVVDIHALSINPADCKGRAGQNETAKQISFPHSPGRDFSGVIRAMGPGVTGFVVGDAVFGVVATNTEATYAEAIAIPEAMIGKKPANVSHVEMAAMALTSLTALIALEDTARVQRGETVLVQGGAGGVGSMGVQLARHLGARVIASASGRNQDYLKSLGADQTLDYGHDDVSRVGCICDVVFDTVGGAAQSRSVTVLKPGGRLVFVARGETGVKAPDDIKMLRPNVVRDRPHMNRVAELIGSGVLKPPAITVMPLAQATEAHALSERHQTRGKIVLTPR
jgi:NADPH:quinone reductase-like Zn-dependent oxidoreductase